jgi:hypothetical protein
MGSTENAGNCRRCVVGHVLTVGLLDFRLVMPFAFVFHGTATGSGFAMEFRAYASASTVDDAATGYGIRWVGGAGGLSRRHRHSVRP